MVSRKEKGSAHWIVPLIVVILVTLIGIEALRASHASKGLVTNTSASNYRVLKVFGAEQESNTHPTDVMRQQADHFAVISDGPHIYDTSQMHAWATADNSTNNGNIAVIQYINGSHLVGGGCAAAKASGIALLNSSGNYLAHQNGPNNYAFLMDIGSSQWQHTLSTSANDVVGSYDGVWFDSLGPSVISSGYNTVFDGSTCQVGGAGTGSPANYNDGQWASAGGALLTAVKHAIPTGKIVAFNGSRTGNDALWGSATIGMDENWLGIKSPNDRPSLNDWKSSLQEITNVANNGKQLEAYVKPCFPDYSSSDCADHSSAMNAAHRFALATFLLGTDGNQLFSFRNNHGATTWDPYWDRLLIGNIQTTNGSYQTVGNVYYRQFTQGFAIVNPDSQAHNGVAIPGLVGNFTDLDNASHSYTGTIDLPAGTGIVLLGASSGNPGVPTVSISAPRNGATVSGANVALAASATGSSITSMQLKVDGSTVTNCASSSCSGTWNSTTVSNSSHNITANATNSAGTGTASITVIVNNTISPSCTGNPTAPVVGSSPTVTSTTVTLMWQASQPASNCTIQGYQVYRDGVSAGQTTHTSFLDTGLTPNTTYSYTVSSIDTDGHKSPSSAAITVTTSKGSTGGVTVSITQPKNNATVRGEVSIAASIAGLRPGHVGFLVDDTVLGYTSLEDATMPWQTGKKDNGVHTITVNVYDSSNLLRTSASERVTVNNVFCLPHWLSFGNDICF